MSGSQEERKKQVHAGEKIKGPPKSLMAQHQEKSKKGNLAKKISIEEKPVLQYSSSSSSD